MPRPARYSVDSLLDAAAALLASDGAAAVTMSAVARATGAPSGSVYHRFPTRAALCGALWVRTQERFLADLLPILTGDADPARRCVAGAVRILEWCRRNPIDAQVLLTGPAALDMADWPESSMVRHTKLRDGLRQVLDAIPVDADRVHAALVDVPHAIVRRHLMAGQVIPDGADAIVADCARALVDGRS
ncbi:TetR/AcrR family transcriptional regulator [Mycobacterium sp. C31M]